MSTRELTFIKKNGIWYYASGGINLSTQYKMPDSTIVILEFAARENDHITLRLLRKNTLEKVKISLGRMCYMKGGALYYVLNFTGAQYGSKELGRRKVWIGNATRKVLNNYPEVINLSW